MKESVCGSQDCHVSKKCRPPAAQPLLSNMGPAFARTVRNARNEVLPHEVDPLPHPSRKKFLCLILGWNAVLQWERRWKQCILGQDEKKFKKKNHTIGSDSRAGLLQPCREPLAQIGRMQCPKFFFWVNLCV